MYFSVPNKFLKNELNISFEFVLLLYIKTINLYLKIVINFS